MTTKQPEQAPIHFLERVQRELRDGSFAQARESGIKDQRLAESVRRRAEELGEDGETLLQSESLERVLSGIAERLIETLSPEEQKELRRLVAVGGLDSMQVQAACMKSESNVFAIIVSYGLMMLAHKLSKLTVAAARPEYVVYCNRGAPQELTTPDYLAFADEMIEHYDVHQEVAGAIVDLSEAGQSAASWLVHYMETFVVGHEVAHFLCGHLNDDDRFVADSSFGSIKVFAENRNHGMEYEADARGFEILRSYADRTPLPRNPEDLLAAVLSVLEVLNLTGPPSATWSHPAPDDRKVAIIDRFYDTASAGRAHDWLRHPEGAVPLGLEWAD